MDISFPDSIPVDPMDGDYLYFEALVDERPIKCCVTFGVLTPHSNCSDNAKLAFWKKKDQLHATARAMIEAGKIEDGEILITRLKPVPILPPHVEVPDVA